MCAWFCRFCVEFFFFLFSFGLDGISEHCEQLVLRSIVLTVCSVL